MQPDSHLKSVLLRFFGGSSGKSLPTTHGMRVHLSPHQCQGTCLRSSFEWSEFLKPRSPPNEIRSQGVLDVTWCHSIYIYIFTNLYLYIYIYINVCNIKYMAYITIHACYMFLSTQTHWRSPSRASCHKVLPLHCNLGGQSRHLKKGKEWTSYREM